MTKKLDYQTEAGQVSEAITFEQLIEHLRLAQEACYVLGHLRKANDDLLIGQGWLTVGEGLQRVINTVTSLAKKKVHESIGWKQ